MKFDELNQLKQHFASMNLSEEEIEKRASLGGLFYDAFYYTLSLMRVDALVNDDLDGEYYTNLLVGRLTDALAENDIIYDDSYVRKIAEDIVNSTVDHYGEEEYFTDDRALELSEDGTNAVCNNAEYIDAKRSGKKKKIWVTENDFAVRPWHAEVDNMKVDIDDYFFVGGEYLRFPLDMENGTAINNARCRCVCRYE